MRCLVLIFVFMFHALPGHAQSARAGAPDASPLGVGTVRGNGLETQVLFAGLDEAEQAVTLTVRITNTAGEPAYLALVGPRPRAVDSLGNAYEVARLAGLAQCASMRNSRIDECIRNLGNRLPGTMFTLIPPGASSLVNIELSARKAAREGFLSFTMNAAMGRGTRPGDDRSADAGLDYINIHLPAIPLK